MGGSGIDASFPADGGGAREDAAISDGGSNDGQATEDHVRRHPRDARPEDAPIPPGVSEEDGQASDARHQDAAPDNGDYTDAGAQERE